MTGGAPEESIYEDFKLNRTKSKNPELRRDTVYVFDYIDYFDKTKEVTIQQIDPLLKPGEIIAFSIKPERVLGYCSKDCRGYNCSFIIANNFIYTNIDLQ